MSEACPPDLDLLRRYRRGSPRHTVHPPLARFNRGFGEAQFRLAAGESNEDPIPRQLSLSVQLPNADTAASPSADPMRITPYLNRLAREIELVAPLFDRDRDVIQLHIGGPCPGRLEPEQVGEIMYTLSRQFFFSRSRERDFSIELEPSRTAPDSIARLADLGFNRASLGAHVFAFATDNPHNFEQTAAAFSACRRAGFRSLEADLPYGLPGQHPAEFNQALQRLLTLRPDRIALFGPTRPNAPADGHVDSLLPPEQRLQLLQLALEGLANAGYEAIGMDQFALAADDLARARRSGNLQCNPLGFNSQADTDLLGFGVGAISQVAETCSQNHSLLADWETALDRGEIPTARGLVLDADDRLRGDILQALMCQGRVEIAPLEERHAIHFSVYFRQALAQLAPLQADGLLEVSPQRIRITLRGRPFVAAACAAFEREGSSAALAAP